ncbi:MAG: hypothetical protein ACT4PL_05660 [Phycisphaerales bacterium]
MIGLASALVACAALACVTPDALARDRGRGGGNSSGGGGSGGASVRNHNVRFIARLATQGGPGKGSADYRERMVRGVLQQTFKVEVERAAPNATLEVRVNGVLFRTVTTNRLGRAHLEFKTSTLDDNPSDDDLPLPTDFPRLGTGSVVTVGPYTGTLVRK